MRLLFALTIVAAFALPISAQAEDKATAGAPNTAPAPSESLSPCSGPANGTCRDGTGSVTNAPAAKGDKFLTLDGIKGESQDDKHKDEIH